MLPILYDLKNLLVQDLKKCDVFTRKNVNGTFPVSVPLLRRDFAFFSILLGRPLISTGLNTGDPPLLVFSFDSVVPWYVVLVVVTTTRNKRILVIILGISTAAISPYR